MNRVYSPLSFALLAKHNKFIQSKDYVKNKGLWRLYGLRSAGQQYAWVVVALRNARAYTYNCIFVYKCHKVDSFVQIATLQLNFY